MSCVLALESVVIHILEKQQEKSEEKSKCHPVEVVSTSTAMAITSFTLMARVKTMGDTMPEQDSESILDPRIHCEYTFQANSATL